MNGTQGAAPDAARALTMLPNSLALIGSKTATMGLGFVFWVIAARLFEPAEVGLAAAIVAAMMLCTQIALVGLGSAVIALLPRELPRPDALLDCAFTLAGALALATGLGFVAIAAVTLGELQVVGGSALYALLFVAATVTGTLGILLDQLSTSLRRGDQVLIRGIAFGLAAVVSLVLAAKLGGGGSAALLAPWVVAGGLAVAIGVVQTRRALGGYLPRAAMSGARTRRLLATGVRNYGLTLAERAPGLLLPVVVTELLSPQTNAAWYAAWMMAWVVFIVPIQVGMTLFAEVAREPASLPAATRHAVRTALLVGVPVAAGLALAAQPALALLGHEYAARGAAPLRILLIGLLPLIFVQAYYASCRGTGRLREAIAAAWITAVGSVGAAALAASQAGLEAMAVAWVLVQAAAAAFAAMRLRVIRLRHEHAVHPGALPRLAPG
ncbi:MAG TPA: oligosaccharide flippase family protein [Solirubrobacteraceae bacterium]|nr:oligosaccharide flippase family protein [Solirubrobacteraceae bacterium]